MRIKRKRRRQLAAELFEKRYLLSAVPAELGLHADSEMGPRDIFAERSGWEHIDLENVPGINDLLSSAGLQERDMAFLQNDLGQVLVRGHTSETILDAVVHSVEQDQTMTPVQRDAHDSIPNNASFLDAEPNVYPPLTTLPDLSSIKHLPGFPENASLTVAPASLGYEVGVSVTVWDTSSAGEPPSRWETTASVEPATTELTTASWDTSEYELFVDVGDVGNISFGTTDTRDLGLQQHSYVPRQLVPHLENLLAQWRSSLESNDANNSLGFTQQSVTQQTPQTLGQDLDFDLQVGQFNNKNALQNAPLQSSNFVVNSNANFIVNDHANGLTQNNNTETPVPNLVSNFILHDSFNSPTVVFDTPIPANTITPTKPSAPPITVSTPVELDIAVSTPVPKHSPIGLPLPRPTVLSIPSTTAPKLHVETLPPVVSWTPTFVESIPEPATPIFAEPKLTAPEPVAPVTTPEFIAPKLTVKSIEALTEPSIASISPISPSSESSIAAPAIEPTFTPIIETVEPQQQTSLGSFTETIPTDPAIQAMSIPTPTVSIATLKDVGDFLEGATFTTESLLPSSEITELPLELDQVELVDEYVEVGEESRQVRVTPTEDDFIDIGDVEAPDVANAYFSPANIQFVLSNAKARTEVETAESSPAPAQEVGIYGSTRRFEAGDFRESFVPMPNTTTSTAPEQETAKPADDAVTFVQPVTGKTRVTMVTQLNSFAAVQPTTATWATQADANSPQDETKSIELPRTASSPSSIDVESDNGQLSIQTRLAKSSLAGSAIAVLFGVSYFESLRAKEQIEKTKPPVTRRLGCRRIH